MMGGTKMDQMVLQGQLHTLEFEQIFQLSQGNLKEALVSELKSLGYKPKSRKGPKALMELPDTACLVMGNHEIGDARNHYIDSDGNVYLCLPDLSAAVLIAGASAYTDTGEPLSFSHRSAQSIRIMEFEEAIELLHAG